MKKLFAFCLIVFYIFTMSGCDSGPIPQSSGPISDKPASSEPTISEPKEESGVLSSQQEVTLAEPQTIQRTLSSGVTIDAKVSIPANVDFSALKSYQGILQRLDINAVKDDLLGAGTEIQETREETRGSRFSDAEYMLFETPDGSSISSTGDMLSYSSTSKADVAFYLRLEPGTEYNGDAFLTDREFSFGTRQECFEKVKSLIGKLGVSVSDEYLCHTIDHETLTVEAQQYRAEQIERARETGVTNEDGTSMTEEDVLKGFPDPDYTAEDDCYSFKLFASAGGFPITRVENGSAENGSLTPGSMIEATVSRDGIVDLYLNGVYQSSETISEGEGLDLDEAISTLDEKYNSIIPDGTYEVEEIAFEYVPISQGDGISAELTPAWRFLMKHTMEFEGKTDDDLHAVTQYENVMFNALTGKEILREVGSI